MIYVEVNVSTDVHGARFVLLEVFLMSNDVLLAHKRTASPTQK